ncbi:MAG: 4Fe-4S dicluster domain-containing protein [Candidatus Hodarchaeales archaeon]|jgi:NAD-dependent dihydropyrimidine dehydrogenase PreA subunit
MGILYNMNRCTGCQFCVQVCPRGCFKFDVDTNYTKIVNHLTCLKCRACELNCEGNALKIEKPIFQNFFKQLF